MTSRISQTGTYIRSSLPECIIRIQSSLESDTYIRNALGPLISKADNLKLVYLRRNHKFRKLIIESGDKRYVLYVHFSLRSVRNLVWFLNLAPKLAVTAPLTLNTNTSLAYYLKHASINATTSYIRGDIINKESPPDALGEIGRQLARLHQFQYSRYGPLITNFPVIRGYKNHLEAYWNKSLNQIGRHQREKQISSTKCVNQWLINQSKVIDNMRKFNLCHGDPAGGNFLITNSYQVSMIDCDHVNFGFGAMEVASALLQKYCDNNEQRREQLVEGYLECCTENDKEIWETNHRFFVAMALLRLSQRKLQWSRKCEKAGNPNPDTKLQGQIYWHALVKLVDQDSSGLNQWQNSLACFDQACSELSKS